MKAIQLRIPGGPEVLELVDVPLPQPGPGQVRVSARAIGAGGPDVLIRNGTCKWMPPLPAVPGNEMAGVARPGGVATALVQVARDRGLRVIGTASTPAKREFALENGAHEVIGGDPHMLADRVTQLTGGRGVDMTFDHIGGALFIACLRALAPGGMAVSYNIVGGPPEGDVFAEMRKLLGRSLAIRTFSIHAIDADPVQRRGLMETAIGLLATGRVRAPRATHFELGDAHRVHELLDSGGTLRKIVLH